MKYINYKQYLSSQAWLLKKHELISVYLQQGWPIRCRGCGSANNLNVHHKDYKEVGDENLSEVASKTGRGVWQLQFLCRDCHQKYHEDEGFRKSGVVWMEDELMVEVFIRLGVNLI